MWTEPQARLCTLSRFRKMENENTHPALQISCQKSWKRAPRLYVVLVEWECGAPSCVLSVVLDPSPSLCTSIWDAFLNFLQFGKNRGVERDLKLTWRLKRLENKAVCPLGTWPHFLIEIVRFQSGATNKKRFLIKQARVSKSRALTQHWYTKLRHLLYTYTVKKKILF